MIIQPGFFLIYQKFLIIILIFFKNLLRLIELELFDESF